MAITASETYFKITSDTKLPRKRREEVNKELRRRKLTHKFKTRDAAEHRLAHLPNELAADCYVAETFDISF